MSHIKLMTALAVLLSLGIGTACKPPAPPVDTAAEAKLKAEEEAQEKIQAEEAAKKVAEEAAKKKAQEDAEAARVKKIQDDAEAARRAAEAALRAAAAGVLVDINFDYNKDEIRRADRAKLTAIAEFLKAFPNARIIIEGHCDERGTEDYNLALGDRRASAAKSYLVGLGISDSDNRFRLISYGKARPKVPGDSEKSWFQNRRCEFKLQ